MLFFTLDTKNFSHVLIYNPCRGKSCPETVRIQVNFVSENFRFWIDLRKNLKCNYLLGVVFGFFLKKNTFSVG